MEGQMRLAIPHHYIYADPVPEPLSLDLLFAKGLDEKGKPFDIPDATSDVELAVEYAEASRKIEAFLDTLGARDRALIEAVYWNGTSQTEIARDFKVSGAAISKRLSRIAALGKVALAPLRDSSLLQ
jgi:RNA polymerase sigma factor (sigma-70 family)